LDTKGSNLDIIQGELRNKEWFEGFKDIIDFIFISCGFSPLNDSSAMKTSSEIYANQEVSKESLNLLRQLRTDQ
jgi:mRNA deadenylase 3'-5' endonuclease subunit Ccr4